MATLEELKHHALNVRRNVIKMVTEAKSGHIGGSFSATEIAVSLYFNEMNITKENVKDKVRDRFVLSKGHASPLLFAVLAEKGFIPTEALLTFLTINSR